jgi:hypothetical protein
MSALGTLRHFAALENLSAIGVTADNGRFWPAAVCPLLTVVSTDHHTLHLCR